MATGQKMASETKVNATVSSDQKYKMGISLLPV
jgi:hypothetical protein